ncbi:hypothetical protein Cni_G16626 [Canna indica]|uniref:Cation/H+ exchanger transmembrane domain-containing protein n=1 Tax=Canna indica TaxID=4628 RepID=A0AAQ3KL78_9LILI|nr:hypothetical protein Cni_G16626 [Canna indica]
MTVLDTLAANIGLLFFLFLVGLELDLKAIRCTEVGTSLVLRSTIVKGTRQAPFLVFMGVALSITAPYSPTSSPLISLSVLLTCIILVVFIAICVHPILTWMACRSPEGEPMKESYVSATLAIVLGVSFVTDTIGIHALFGAFVVPKDGIFVRALIEKVEDLVSSLFFPLYLVSNGLMTNVATISSGRSWGLLVLVIANACIASLAIKILLREAVTISFLMNTKGLVELIILNIRRDRKVLNDETSTIMVLMTLFTTFITTPSSCLASMVAARSPP